MCIWEEVSKWQLGLLTETRFGHWKPVVMTCKQKTSAQMFFPSQHRGVETLEEILIKISNDTLNGFLTLNELLPKSHWSLISKEFRNESGYCCLTHRVNPKLLI